MLARVHSYAVVGLEDIIVEVDYSNGLPAVIIDRLPGAAVQVSRARRQTAVKNAGLHFPPHRIVVNLSPPSARRSLPTICPSRSTRGLHEIERRTTQKLVHTLEGKRRDAIRASGRSCAIRVKTDDVSNSRIAMLWKPIPMKTGKAVRSNNLEIWRTL